MHLSANSSYNNYNKAEANGRQLWHLWPSLVVFGWDL